MTPAAVVVVVRKRQVDSCTYGRRCPRVTRAARAAGSIGG